MSSIQSYMTITVRVITAQALAQLKAAEARILALERQLATGSVAAKRFGTSLNGMNLVRFGSQMQWVGRQIQYNFTIPIIAAAGFATKFALDNEKAFVRVAKVYGDGSQSAAVLKNELAALQKNFVALSNRFGVAQKDAINIAADWASAGSSGIALAKATELTMRTMVLGEIDAATATESLIAIQAQYRLSTQQLTSTIYELNSVENQTGIKLKGLIEGFARASGVARSAGVDTRHLAAMLAAMSPAAGSAAQAGNALKTIISRLLSPTKEATEVLGLMNIHMTDQAWKSANASQRLQILADSYEDLGGAQRAVVSAVVASRYQINKFDVLMDAIINKNSYYYKALQASSSATNNATRAQSELNTVLQSAPQRLKIIWTLFQNQAAEVGQHLIPTLVMLANAIRMALQWFNNLDPSLRKFILYGLAIIAVIGPIIRYFSALAVAVGILQTVFMSAGGVMISFITTLWSIATFPFTLISTAFAFIGTKALAAVTSITRAFAALPVLILSILFKGFLLLQRPFIVLGIGLQVIAAELWFALQRIWIAGIFALQRVILAASAALGVAWRSMHVMLTLISATFTRSIPMLWSTMVFAMATIMTVGGAALTKLWSAIWFSLQRIVLAGATAAGAVYRAALAGWMTLTVAFSIKWRSIWLFIASVPGKVALLIGRAMPFVVAALTGPWGIAIAAIVGAFVIFYNDIKALFQSIIAFFKTGVQGIGSSASGLVRLFWGIVEGIQKAFFKLPEGVRDAMMAVVNIVRSAAMAVYRFFSYLNPFAHHSPSLVENVTSGMSVVADQFGIASDAIEGHIKNAYASIKAFGTATRSFMDMVAGIDVTAQRSDVGKFSSGAIGSFDALISSLRVLKGDLDAIGVKVQAQQSIVDGWKLALDNANLALDKQQNILDVLSARADHYADQLSAAKEELDRFADTPITGMRAFEDAIFANEMAQKSLRLEMLRFEDANGSIDEMRNKVEKLAGSIELTRGQQAELRAAGAGSEILSGYDDQINQLEQQQQAINDTADQYRVMEDALDELQRKAEMLDLQEALQFDPLLRQIDQLAKGLHELPFDEIMAGITNSKQKVDQLTAAYNEANLSVIEQKAVVDALKLTRDQIQASYDAENTKLGLIKDQYDKVNDAIQDIKSSLGDMSTAARNAEQALRDTKDAYLSPGAQNFLDAAGGDFPDVGGLSGVGREFPGIPDQSKMIEDFTKQLEQDLDNALSDLNPFNWIKKKWNDFKGWWTGTVVPWFKGLFSGLSIDTSKFEGMGKFFSDLWDDLDGFFSAVSDLFAPSMKRLGEVLGKLWQQMKDELGPALADLGKSFKELWVAVQPIVGPMLTGLKYLLGFIVVVFATGIKGSLDIIIHVFHGLLGGIITAVKGIIQVVSGIIKFLTGVFTLDWKKAWEGIKQIFVGLWNVIFGLLKGILGGIYGFFKGWITSIVDWFKWLYDKVVGHSIIPDLVRDVVAWFMSLPGKVIGAILGLIAMVTKWARDVWNAITAFMKAGWNALLTWLKSIPGLAVGAISSLVQRMSDLATNAWRTFLNVAKSFVDGKGGLIGFLASIPGRAASALASLGATVANAVKGAWNGAAGFLNDKVIGNINKVTSPFGVKLPTLPKFAKGGVIPGAVSKKDNIMIAARTGEGILIPEAVRQLGGARGIAMINRMATGAGNKFGQIADGIQHFEGGGVVNWFKSNVIDKVTGWASKGAGFALEQILKPTGRALREVMPDGFLEDILVGLVNKTVAGAKSWGDKQNTGGTANTGSSGSVSVDAILRTARKFYPGARVSSGVRDSNDYHGRGLAADLVGGGESGMIAMARGFYNISGKLLELIHSGGGGFFAKNGKRVGAGYYSSEIANHWDHVHVAARADALGYDRGGPLPAGVTMASNTTGKLEWVLTAEELNQLAAMGDVISMVMGAVGGAGLKGGSIGGSGTLAARGFAVMAASLMSIDARLARIEASPGIIQTQPTVVNVNIGTLSMPGISSSKDAEEFLRNLEALARSQS